MKKVNLLYDATIICNIMINNSSRSGIFFVAYNVLLELLKREDLNIYLYAEKPVKLKMVLNQYKEFNKCRIYKPVLSDYVSFLADVMSNSNNKLIKILCSLQASLVKRISKFYFNHFVSLDDIDVYFSPMRAVPAFAARNKHVKKYTILHDVIPIINSYRENAGHRWFYNMLNSINSEDKYFANSEYTKQDFIKYVPKINGENIKVIPLSTGKPYFKLDDKMYVNQIKRKYGIPTDKKYIFSLCNLDPRKNLIFAIKNFLRFVDKNKLDDFIFVLGGAHFYDFVEIMNKNIEDLGKNQEKILRIGYVEDDDMSALYSGAEMFVFPSLYEGFGIPVLEAMKCGLPVICSNASSLPEVIGDCGIQINPYSDDELISAMEKMYYDREFRENCIAKGLERAKLFTWKKCVDVIENQIKKDLEYENFSSN